MLSLHKGEFIMVKMIMLPDLHWGAISPERMKEELDKTLFKIGRAHV